MINPEWAKTAAMPYEAEFRNDLSAGMKMDDVLVKLKQKCNNFEVPIACLMVVLGYDHNKALKRLEEVPAFREWAQANEELTDMFHEMWEQDSDELDDEA